MRRYRDSQHYRKLGMLTDEPQVDEVISLATSKSSRETDQQLPGKLVVLHHVLGKARRLQRTSMVSHSLRTSCKIESTSFSGICAPRMRRQMKRIPPRRPRHPRMPAPAPVTGWLGLDPRPNPPVTLQILHSSFGLFRLNPSSVVLTEQPQRISAGSATDFPEIGYIELAPKGIANHMAANYREALAVVAASRGVALDAEPKASETFLHWRERAKHQQ